MSLFLLEMITVENFNWIDIQCCFTSEFASSLQRKITNRKTSARRRIWDLFGILLICELSAS
jgi:hypothetical protein